MNRLLFVCGICVLLGAGCGSSSTTMPSATIPPSDAPSATVREMPTTDAIVSPPSSVGAPASSGALEDTVLETLAVTMASGNFFFDPATITASPGQVVSISIAHNEGTHTFVIEEIGLKKQITAGAVVAFTAPTVPGSYAYYCDVGAHRKLGMEGVLIVK